MTPREVIEMRAALAMMREVARAWVGGGAPMMRDAKDDGEIHFEAFDPEKVGPMIERWHYGETAQQEYARAIFSSSTLPLAQTFKRKHHPLHTFRLATQDIRVAFDDATRTLFVGETGRGGYERNIREEALTAAARCSRASEMLVQLRQLLRALPRPRPAIADDVRAWCATHGAPLDSDDARARGAPEHVIAHLVAAEEWDEAYAWSAARTNEAVR